MPASSIPRRMWALYEPVHAVSYFAPESFAAFEDVGLRGFWRGYFAGRACPLGAVGPAPVTAAFFSFAPSMVGRALPAVWDLAPPEQALRARIDGAVAALDRLLPGHDFTRAAELLEIAADGLDLADMAGRVLGAANAALPRPDRPVARLWHAATVLREHRGDGHIAALVAADLTGCETLVVRAALDLSRENLQPARGWTDGEWDRARQRLVERGWFAADGTATRAVFTAFREIENATDRAALRPWNVLGSARTEELGALLAPVAHACSTVLRFPNPMGLPPTPPPAR